MSLRLTVLLLALLLLSPLSAAVANDGRETAPSPVVADQPWWDNYARDRNHDGLSDLLVWKLAQGDRFFAPGEARIFVSYDHYPSDDDMARLVAAGAEVTYRARYLDLLAATLSRELVREVAEWPGVVMLDDVGRAVPHMHEAVPAMEVDQVWEQYGYDGEGVAIAIVDTGIDGTHVGLDDLDDNPLTDDPKITGFYDAIYTNAEHPPEESYDSGTHGSHVAGIAAGTGDGDTASDGRRYIGAAPGAKLINVLSCCDGDIADIIEGIEWTIANMDRFGIRVMTSSLGEQQIEYHVDNDGNSPWSRAADAAMEAGIVVTLSAGNELGAMTVMGCNTIDSPGDARLPITVAALDKDLGLAVYSSRGYTSDGRVKPDVATIGSSIMAPDAASQLGQDGKKRGYTSKSGTSMATPLMAGIAALTLQANPDLTPAEFKDTIVGGYAIEREILDESDITNDCSLLETRPDNEYGYGQADPLVFVEVAGKIDATLNVTWDLGPVEQIVNGTTVLVKPEVPNGTWLTGTAVGAGAQIGVEVRFGASQWYLATDTSSGGDWSKWKVQVPPEVPKGNQTLMARLVVDTERMSPVATLSVVLRDEYAPAPEEETPAPGFAWAALLAVAMARRRRSG